jgi:hypothetical protein
MKILSYCAGYATDHSSSTYEFYSLDRLTKEQKETVERLTGQQPRGRKISFHYWGDFQDIPSGWVEKLLSDPYDIMVSESYDWWSTEMSLPYDEDLLAKLGRYECEYDACGFRVRHVDDKMLLSFGYQLEYGAAYAALGSNPFHGLADLLEEIRGEILAGDFSALRVIYECYGGYAEELEEEESGPLSESAETLRDILFVH